MRDNSRDVELAPTTAGGDGEGTAGDGGVDAGSEGGAHCTGGDVIVLRTTGVNDHFTARSQTRLCTPPRTLSHRLSFADRVIINAAPSTFISGSPRLRFPIRKPAGGPAARPASAVSRPQRRLESASIGHQHPMKAPCNAQTEAPTVHINCRSPGCSRNRFTPAGHTLPR